MRVIAGQRARWPLLALVFTVTALLHAQGYVDDQRHSTTEDADERKTWPDQYQVSWEIDIPYIKELQKGGLRYNYTAWQDTLQGRQKTIRNGVEGVIEFLDNNTMYQTYPRIDTWGCRTLEIAGGSGPTRRLLENSKPELTLVLPDWRQDRWRYNSTARIERGRHSGTPSHAYTWTVGVDEGYGNVTSTYTFYIGLDGHPLRLYMWGRNLYTEGHFDAYVVDYYGYAPGAAPADTWSVPDACPSEPEPENFAARPSHWLSLLRSALPSTHYGDAAYDAFAHHYGRRHSSHLEYTQRQLAFKMNRGYIDGHNRRTNASAHRLGLNRFADWADAEFEAVMLPNRGRPRPPMWPPGQQPRVHAPSVPAHMLPSTVDWRGTGADSPVKDQAMCGSCWAFGSVGSLEAAYFRKSGRQLLLSEQHLMDCAWDAKDENKACMGGFQNLAFQWVLPRGGIASEADYPYEGVTNFCRNDTPLAAKFREGEYVEVRGGERGLMEALLTKGPMTVSVDAAPKSFLFYESGIYTEPACQTRLDKLDHAVIVSGYGTEDGHDYWIVKNTWSPFWGEAGYLRIARRPDDCGISTQPIYIEFELE